MTDEVITTSNYEVMNAIVERIEKVYGTTLKVTSDSGKYTVTIPASIYFENKTFLNPQVAKDVEQGCKAWLSGNAYIDDNGNYHLRPQGKISGPIASWNKAVKSNFSSVSHFHQYVQVNRARKE